MALVNARRSFQLAIPENSQDQSETGAPKTMNRRVPVLYYLSRNGQLEHPHFIEVPLSSPDGGLYLRDVMHRLDYLRGEGMANLYSWSSKRSYRNGFVWQDLCENDFIHPSHGHEYVLKGSELLHTPLRFKSSTTSSPENRAEPQNSGDDSVTASMKSRSWSSSESREYKVFKTTYTAGDIAGKLAADASTQTGDERGRRMTTHEEDRKVYGHDVTELNREELSLPSSSSSTETLEMVDRSTDVDLGYRTAGIDNHGSGRMKVSAALMQLITCGSTSVKECESTDGKDGECEVEEQGRRLSRDARYQV